MPDQPRRPTDAVRFMLEEASRFQGLILSGGVSNLDRDDLLCGIPADDGQGYLIFGKAAEMELLALARAAGERSGAISRVRFQGIRDALAQEIAYRFIRQGSEINDRQVDRAIHSAGQAALRACIDRTVYIPCHLMVSKEPDEIAIGPVRFLSRHRFQRIIGPKLKSSLASIAPRDRVLIARSLRHYRNFAWVAEVRVGGFDFDTGKTVARRAVTSTLDCIHLMFGSFETRRMQVDGYSLRADRRGYLSVYDSGEIVASNSHGGFGQLGYEDGWSGWLSNEGFGGLIDRFAVALEAVLRPGQRLALARRALDAAQWYGEACRDDRPSSAVIKHLTAVETLVTAGRHADIDKNLQSRVGILCTQSGKSDDRLAWEQCAKKAYDLRSHLVHGSISPEAEEVVSGLRLCAEVARASIIGFLMAFGDQQFRAETFNEDALNRWYNERERMEPAAK